MPNPVEQFNTTYPLNAQYATGGHGESRKLLNNHASAICDHAPRIWNLSRRVDKLEAGGKSGGIPNGFQVVRFRFSVANGLLASYDVIARLVSVA